jgi:hypothetical protein
MAAIYRERTARVEHRCEWDCRTPIRPGERYVMSSLTPNDGDVGNLGWLHGALHGRSRYECPDYAVADTAGQGPPVPQP